MSENLYKALDQLTDQEICDRIIGRELTHEAYLIACEILSERAIEVPDTGGYRPSNKISEETSNSIREFYTKHPYIFIWIIATAGLLIMKWVNWYF